MLKKFLVAGLLGIDALLFYTYTKNQVGGSSPYDPYTMDISESDEEETSDFGDETSSSESEYSSTPDDYISSDDIPSPPLLKRSSRLEEIHRKLEELHNNQHGRGNVDDELTVLHGINILEEEPLQTVVILSRDDNKIQYLRKDDLPPDEREEDDDGDVKYVRGEKRVVNIRNYNIGQVLESEHQIQ